MAIVINQASDKDKHDEVPFVKACRCRGTSTTGRILVTSKFDPKTLSVRVEAIRHNGPVCDNCNKPWDGPYRHVTTFKDMG